MDVKITRMKNSQYLSTLLDGKHKQAELIKFMGKPQSAVSGWLSGDKNIGDDVAREFNQAFSGMITSIGHNPDGWMDMPHPDLWGEGEPIRSSSTCDYTLIAKSTEVVESYLKYNKFSMSPKDKGELISSVFRVYELSGASESTDAAVRTLLSATLKTK